MNSEYQTPHPYPHMFVGTHKDCLNETVLLSTHMCFGIFGNPGVTHSVTLHSSHECSVTEWVTDGVLVEK